MAFQGKAEISLDKKGQPSWPFSELYGSKHPCHRVVNAAGRLAPGWEDQRHLLWAEGVDLKANGCVDLKRYQWEL